ncbi:BatD family protein [Desulfolithobacter sp.]
MTLVLAICLFFSLIAGTIGLAADQVKVAAQLNTSEFPEDQAALLTVTVNGAGSAKVARPEAEGLEIIYQGQNRQMQWLNGKYTSSISFVFIVQPLKAGNHTIKPIKVEVDGKILETQPVTCNILPVNATTAPSAGKKGGAPPVGPQTRLRSGEAEKIGFMRIIPDKKTVYSGELVPFTVKAFFRQGLRATIKSAPRITGDTFMLEYLDDQPQQSEELVDGIPYTVVTWHGAFSGVKEGDFSLEVELDASLLVRTRTRRPASPLSPFFNDPFFDDFFGNYTHREVKLVSPELVLHVNDLPEEGRPADFKGAIGTFSLAVTGEPLEGKVGDPITLKMKIRGTGNFDRVQAPVFAGNPKEWKSYPPSDQFADQGNGQGEKTFTQVIVPTDRNIGAIPPVSFSYFDPRAETYITLTSDPIPLKLQQDESESNPLPLQQENTGRAVVAEKIKKTGPRLAPIHMELGRMHQAITPVYKKIWFLTLLGASLLLLVTGIMLRQYRQRLAADPMIARRKEVDKKLAACLRDMEKAASAGDSSTFLKSCRTAIQEAVGLRLNMEPQAITLADLKNRPEENTPLFSLLEQTEHACYMGTELDQETMLRIIKKLNKLILQKEI